MTKNIIITFCLVWCSTFGNAQNHQFAIETGYNRIGVFINPNIGIDFRNHQIHLGLKTYGYNLFFQSNPIGPQIGYQYNFTTTKNKIYFYPSISYSAFREQKSTSNLLLSEINLKYAFGLNVSKRISFVNEIGMGYIMSNTNLFNELNTIKSAYPNFEISLGLVFHVNKSTN